ncbi:hypothetical protein KP509_23G044800 [Ceratopteris richardii]|uniref:Uncharacterized protein n=1 Tax=Ceratopteris richardii TaxID=49495 RepID=A0A8T2RZ63_CERRI|nr:hypothetical protein KP509_23G044800 [Ceratopteris richardii]
MITFLEALTPCEPGENNTTPTSEGCTNDLVPSKNNQQSWSCDALPQKLLSLSSPWSATCPSVHLAMPLFPQNIISLCKNPFGSGSQSLGDWSSAHSRCAVHLDSRTYLTKFQDLITSSFARATSSTHGPNDANQITPLIPITQLQFNENVLDHLIQRQHPSSGIQFTQTHLTYLPIICSFNSACPNGAGQVSSNHADSSSTTHMECLLTFIYVRYVLVTKSNSLDYRFQQILIEKEKRMLNTQYNFVNNCRCPPTHSSPECRRQEVIRKIFICVTRRYFSLILVIDTDDRAQDNQFRVFDPGIFFLPIFCMLQFSVWGGEQATLQTFECRQSANGVNNSQCKSKCFFLQSKADANHHTVCSLERLK